ncbi:cyclohexanone monooxygenase, partial [Streptomyces sp. NPDC127051]
LGCKRLLTPSTYYPALSRPHVRLHPTAVSAVRSNEVVGADGTVAETDVLITATGFRVGELPLARTLYGTGGRSLHDAWGGEPQAYLGTTVSGFPNLFLLLGPNLLGGSTSAITVLEAQLTYLTSALTHLDQTGSQALEVRPGVQDAHNSAVQAALETTVYNTGGCTSYYLTASGRNTFSWPWSTPRLTRRLNRFDPAAYVWQPPCAPLPAPRTAQDDSVQAPPHRQQN